MPSRNDASSHSRSDNIAAARLCFDLGSQTGANAAMLKLAQHAAYTAIHQALCKTFADQEVPNGDHPANKQAWNKAFRFPRHSAFSQKEVRSYGDALTRKLTEFMRIGADLREKRTKANYDYWHNPSPKDVQADILNAEKALSIMDNAPDGDKAALAKALRSNRSRQA